MRQTRAQRMLGRQWRLMTALRASRHGRCVRQLMAELGVSRATLYRDIAMLEAAGVPIHRSGVNGEVRYRVVF